MRQQTSRATVAQRQRIGALRPRWTREAQMRRPAAGRSCSFDHVAVAVGVVERIWRYPVKSVGGELVERADVDERGLVGDRLYAVRDAEGRFGSGKNTRRFRRMAACWSCAPATAITARGQSCWIREARWWRTRRPTSAATSAGTTSRWPGRQRCPTSTSCR
ncbi:MOSC N-terminal beta barrel domain-containing protein [Saccharopolyspora spinosporotrichia]